MKPTKEYIGRSHIRMFNVDCVEFMKFYDNYDLAIVDPQYGIGESSRVRSRTGTRKVKQKNGTTLIAPCDGYLKKKWDSKPPDKKYFDELLSISNDQIIWGVNNFNVQLGPGRIFWDKVNESNDFSDGELAYCSFHNSTRLIRYMWNGMMQGKSISEGWIQDGNKKEQEKRIHPTQKPVKLYRWLLNKYAIGDERILDTHGGSMSIAIACWDLGFDLDICELDTDYFNDAVKRFENHIAQKQLVFS